MDLANCLPIDYAFTAPGLHSVLLTVVGCLRTDFERPVMATIFAPDEP